MRNLKSNNEDWTYCPDDELGFIESNNVSEAPVSRHYVSKQNSRIKRNPIGFKQKDAK